MAKYKVKHTSILHNGNLYKEGSTIELDDKYAAKLEDFVERLPSQTTAKAKTQTQNKTQTTKNANKTKSETKTEAPDTSKDGKGDGKSTEQGGGVDNDK